MAEHLSRKPARRYGRSMTAIRPAELATPRAVAVVAAVVAATLYCQAHALVTGGARVSVGESLLWAGATLAPWFAALALFERREPSIRAAVMLAAAATLASAGAIALLAGDAAAGLYARLPTLPAAAIYAWLRIEMQRQRTPVRAAGEALPCAPADILLASAAENYVELHLPHRTLLWRQTMQAAEAQLAAHGFQRVHRSYLVPRRRIAAVHGRTVELDDGRRVPVSRRYRRVLPC